MKDRPPLYQARLAPWSINELKNLLTSIVDILSNEKLPVSPLDVACVLLDSELEAYVLFTRLGHLDPPREDGKIPIGILRRMSVDPKVDVRIREAARKWVIDQEGRS